MPAERIAFAACCKINFDEEQLVWRDIAQQQPSHLLLLGDQIYMDYKGDHALSGSPAGMKGYELNEPASISLQEFEEQMRLRYRLQYQVPLFQDLLRQVAAAGGQVGMVWDDHDFGFNNAIGRLGGPMDPHPDYQGRYLQPDRQRISRRLFEEFRRSVLALGRPGDTGYVQLPADWVPDGKPGVEGALSLVQADVLLLDTRTHRQSPNDTGNPAKDADILGAEQWAWLEAQARASNKLVVVAAGSPLSSPGLFSDQSWKQAKHGGRRPYREYTQLLQLAQQLAAAGKRMLFIGGDRHTIELIDDHAWLPEIVCAGSAAPKGLFSTNGRHFGLLDVQPGDVHVSLFKTGRAQIKAPLFGGAWSGLQRPGTAALAPAPAPTPAPATASATPAPAPVAAPVAAPAAAPAVVAATGAPAGFMICMRAVQLDDAGAPQFSNMEDDPTYWVTTSAPSVWDNASSWRQTDRAAFIAALLQRTAAAGAQAQLCFYIHGALHGWGETATKYADVVQGRIFPALVPGVPVFVAWPARKTVEAAAVSRALYEDSAGKAMAAGQDLGEFFAALHAQAGGAVPRLSLLASSMGNRVALAALKSLQAAAVPMKFDRWVALAADLDANLFDPAQGDAAAVQAIAQHCTRLLASYSSLDDMLPRLEPLAGRKRLGQTGFVPPVPASVTSHNVDAVLSLVATGRHAAMLHVAQGIALVGEALR